mmetsp:Transcript_41609/g.106477  ORF Transcript_41609/g.106477 Transcript_41609/m.106477 type:complete len:177 (+) Transcript_41609:233-763(+)
MPVACGLRIGLGVCAGNPAVVGSGVATTTHTQGVSATGQRNKASPQSSPQCHGSYFVTSTGPARKAVTVSQARERRDGSPDAIIVRLGNLPDTVLEEELAEILAPWGQSVGNVAMESCSESGKRTFTAQMEYQAGLDAISKLHQSLISGHQVEVVGESVPIEGTEAEEEDADVILE